MGYLQHEPGITPGPVCTVGECQTSGEWAFCSASDLSTFELIHKSARTAGYLDRTNETGTGIGIGTRTRTETRTENGTGLRGCRRGEGYRLTGRPWWQFQRTAIIAWPQITHCTRITAALLNRAIGEVQGQQSTFLGTFQAKNSSWLVHRGHVKYCWLSRWSAAQNIPQDLKRCHFTELLWEDMWILLLHFAILLLCEVWVGKDAVIP